MLKVSDLKMEYVHLLFDGISFVLGNQEKVGLVGLNGCGKTTLLNIIAGKETPERGSVELSKHERLEYLPQTFSFPEGMLVGEFLEELVEDHLTEMWKVDKILSRMDVYTYSDHPDPDDQRVGISIYQELRQLSEGQKMKIYLASLLINEPTILLLDEPTNHLDIEGIMWFEQFVATFKGICIIISHDRQFLNNTITKVFEMDEYKLNVFEGNYDDYVDQKSKWVEDRAETYRRQELKRKQLDDLLRRARKLADGKSRSKKVKAAKKRMEREVTSREIKEYQEAKIGELDIAGQVHNTKTILQLQDVHFRYDREKPLIEGAELEMFGAEKLWLYGANGVGKTTLIKLIVGELQPSSGKVKMGVNLNWEYFSQDQQHLDSDQTVRDFFVNNTPLSYYQAFGVLESFLFSEELQQYRVGRLSPGQRARLSFAVFSQFEYDFLILDEPTNHLDIRTKEVIEDSLRKFRGALLLISHDRYFVESIGMDRMVTIEAGQLHQVK